MRDRLIELLMSGHREYLYYDQIADYLLEKGIVVPPCEIGDRMWHLSRSGNVYEVVVKEVRVIWKKRNPKRKILIYAQRVDDRTTGRYPYKGFYRTEEEANDALKAREQGVMLDESNISAEASGASGETADKP